MKQSIEEHHGYFSMDMNCARLTSFENGECLGKRFCMLYLREGEMRLTESGKTLKLRAPVLVCRNEREPFFMDCSEPAVVAVLHPHILNSAFDFENVRDEVSRFSVSEQQDCYFLIPFLEHSKGQDGVYLLDAFLGERISKLFLQFEREITAQDTNFWPCRSRSCFMEILSLIVNGALARRTDEKETLVAEIKAYLISHMEQKITISDLTREFHRNRTDLSRIFQEETGTTIMTFLKEQRMEFAATLMRNTGLPCTVVMEKTGFSQYPYFSRAFKEYTGLSPREYRNCNETK